jgi:hypothetical protein
MIGPDGDLNDFPPWIWPYIRVEQLGRTRIFAAEEAATTAVPHEALLGHFVAIVQAVQLKSVAKKLDGSVGTQLGNVAGQAIADEIDDWCGTRPRPIPHPHRAAQLATYLATFSASSNNEILRGELNAVVEQISARIASSR